MSPPFVIVLDLIVVAGEKNGKTRTSTIGRG
jgi:hypothetical protein